MRFTIWCNEVNFSIIAMWWTCLLAYGLGTPAHAEEWQRIVSPTGYSILYPSGWVGGKFFESDGRIDLEDAENADQQGAIIAAGHAHIRAMEEPDSDGTTLPQVIATYRKDVLATLEQKSVPVFNKDTGCQRLTKLTVRDSPLPPELSRMMHGQFQIFVDYFCQTTGHRIMGVSALYWEDDKRAKLYQQIALRMAQSIEFQH